MDEDLKLLDTEIKADRDKAGLGDDFPASARLDSGKQGRGRGRVMAAVAAAEGVPEKKRRGRKRALQEDDEDGAHSGWPCPPAPSLGLVLMPVVPPHAGLMPLPAENEPLYCYCQKPSHGEMVVRPPCRPPC